MGGVSMEWKEVRLGDVIRTNESQYSIREHWDNFVYLDTGSLTNGHIDSLLYFNKNDKLPSRARRKVKQGDILYSCVRPNQRHYGYIDNPISNLLVSTGFVVITCKDIDSKYLYYYLGQESTVNYLQNLGEQSVSTYPTIKPQDIEDLNILLPSNLEDQRRIASILSSLDRKIELNNKINADLEEMAQAIFKNWLSECTDEVTIGELSLNITNYEKTNAEEVVLINSSDVTEGYFDHHDYSPNKNLKGHFKKRFQKGDILYSQVRPRNRHWAYCNFDANDYLASTQLMVIRNNPSLITSILLYQYIISDNVWKEFTLKTETRSGTFPQGNYEDLSQIRVPYNSDVKGISNQLETLYAKMFMLEKENSRLSLLRDTLLPRLMSGEIEVPQ